MAGEPHVAVAGSAPGAAPTAPAAAPIVPKVTRASRPRRRFISQIPASITDDPALISALAALPANYNFEIPKTIWRLQQLRAQRVALQFPEGLLIFATTIADILHRFSGAEPVIMGDVTYGACCVDDLAAAALGCGLLVHYGHSCLVPIDRMAADVLYVFVEVAIDVPHLVDSLTANLPPDTRLAMCATVQFTGALHAARASLASAFAYVHIPQAKPLSAGESLGCTAPKIEGCDAVVFVADGRFHPEAVMIANPQLPLYRYDPYAKALTQEGYDHARMRSLRHEAVRRASQAATWGLVLGTLGRQGNPEILTHLQELIKSRGLPCVTVLLSEVLPSKLAAFPDVGAWVQICCPRLSIDWGHAFEVPLLSPYEAEVALGARDWLAQYPMDYYAKAGGSYANYAKAEERAATRAECCRRSGTCGEGGGAEGCNRGDECCSLPQKTTQRRSGPSEGSSEAATSHGGGGVDAGTDRPDQIFNDEAAVAVAEAVLTDGPGAAGFEEAATDAGGRGGGDVDAALTADADVSGGVTRASGCGSGVLSAAQQARTGLGVAGVVVEHGQRDPRLVEQCATIERKCFAKHEAMDVPFEAKKRGAVLLCVLRQEGVERVCIGYAIAQRSSVALTVTKLVVHPAHRRLGVGRLLMSHALELAHSGRAQVCSLHVDEANTPARRLYESLGFKRVDTRRDYYAVGRHALVMELQT